jgi:16S rRNA (adenine1518-N6/adenine1519-N6)-dimethyltransferase
MRKKLGQNFLIRPDLRRRLLDALEISAGDPVWEIGPGLGAMTAGLLDRGAELTAFEIDRGFAQALGELFQGAPGFTLVPGDVFKTWPETDRRGDYLLGNLPYNIAAQLLADFIEKRRFFKRMVVTVQKEVARRITAGPGSKDYSSFSVLCASAYSVVPLMVMKGAAFYPEPAVESQGIRFDLRTGRDPGGYAPCFQPLVRGLFGSRRKTVKNNLERFVASFMAPRGGKPRSAAEIAAEALSVCGIDPGRRAETLGVEDFAALAEYLEKTSPPEAARGNR